MLIQFKLYSIVKKCQHFSDLPTFPVDDVYGGGAAEGMADVSEFPVDDEDIPDTGMSFNNCRVL